MKQTRIKLDAADTLLFEQILVDAFVKNDELATRCKIDNLVNEILKAKMSPDIDSLSNVLLFSLQASFKDIEKYYVKAIKQNRRGAIKEYRLSPESVKRITAHVNDANDENDIEENNNDSINIAHEENDVEEGKLFDLLFKNKTKLVSLKNNKHKNVVFVKIKTFYFEHKHYVLLKEKDTSKETYFLYTQSKTSNGILEDLMPIDNEITIMLLNELG